MKDELHLFNPCEILFHFLFLVAFFGGEEKFFFSVAGFGDILFQIGPTLRFIWTRSYIIFFRVSYSLLELNHFNLLFQVTRTFPTNQEALIPARIYLPRIFLTHWLLTFSIGIKCTTQAFKCFSISLSSNCCHTFTI